MNICVRVCGNFIAILNFRISCEYDVVCVSSIKLMKIECVMKIRAGSSRKLRAVVVVFWGAFHVDFFLPTYLCC